MSSAPDHLYLDLSIVNNDTSGDSTIPLNFREYRTNPILDNPANYYMSVARFEVDTPGFSLPMFIPKLRMDGVNDDINSTAYSVTMGVIDKSVTPPVLTGISQKYVEWTPQDKNAKLPNNEIAEPIVVTRTFYTSGDYVIPAGVTSWTITAVGGAGGGSSVRFSAASIGGNGERVVVNISNAGNEFNTIPLKIEVGQGGLGGGGGAKAGFGGQGGGYSRVVAEGSGSIVVAGGGGGAGGLGGASVDAYFGQGGDGGNAHTTLRPQPNIYTMYGGNGESGNFGSFVADIEAGRGGGYSVGDNLIQPTNGLAGGGIATPPTTSFGGGGGGTGGGIGSVSTITNGQNGENGIIFNGSLVTAGGGGGGAGGGSQVFPQAVYKQLITGVTFSPASNAIRGLTGDNGFVTITYSIPSRVSRQDITTGYYNCYSPRWWLSCVNRALSECYAGLPVVANGYAPQLVIDADTNLITLMTPYIQTAIDGTPPTLNFAIGEDVASISDYLGTPAGTTSRDDVITHSLFFNEPLYNLFSSFNSIKYGKSFPPSSLSASSQLIVNNFPEGYKIFSNYIQPLNYNLLNTQITSSPQATATNKWILLYSEYSPVPMWNPIQSIMFNTSMIPVQYGMTNPPQVYGSTIYDKTYIGEGGNNSDISTMISDIQIPLTSGNEYKPTITYTPRGEYRMIDLLGNSPINQIGFSISYKTKFGEVIPFALGPQCGANLKILFRRKRYNLGNVFPYDTN